MEKFTRKLAYSPEYIKTFDDAGMAQLGHLNGIIDNTVSSITAGSSNVTITPLNGKGNVTITVTNSTGIITTTYINLQTLISTNSLIPSALYKITGFNKNMPSGSPENPNGYLPEILYDDGTNSGITIYMQAISTNELATSGYGEFYNPKYTGAPDYFNTDGTGLYQIWDGDNPVPADVPAYQVGDVVFWGGYAWENTSGLPGTFDNTLTLNANDWVKLPYSNSTWYDQVVDEIKVDWNNGILIERYNPENQVRVAFNADQYYWWMGLYDDVFCSPISGMAWGLYSKVTPEQLDTNFCGISNVEVINSYCGTLSFKGLYLLNTKIYDSYIYFDSGGLLGYCGKNTEIQNNTFTAYSYVGNNLLLGGAISGNVTKNGNVYSNTLIGASIADNRIYDGFISSNTLDNTSISSNVLTQSYIEGNTSTNSSNIFYNNVSEGSFIKNNTLSNFSYIRNNTVMYSSYIINNTLSNSGVIDLCDVKYSSYIDNNIINSFTGISKCIVNQLAFIQSNNLQNFSTLSDVVLNNSSKILNNSFNSTDIRACTLSNSVFDFSSSGTIINKNIVNINAKTANLVINISAATVIFGTYSKEIFLNSAFAQKISYINGSDVLTVVNVNA